MDIWKQNVLIDNVTYQAEYTKQLYVTIAGIRWAFLFVFSASYADLVTQPKKDGMQC